MEDFLNIFIDQEANDIPTEFTDEINKKLPYYKNIQNDSLSYLFAYYHFKLNHLLEFLNSKINVNRRYNADESRELISIIDNEENLYSELKNSKYSFCIVTTYLDIIKLCKTFLSESGGSAIPEDFTKITITTARPIFHLTSTIQTHQYRFETKLIGEGSYAKVLKYKDNFYNKYFAIKKANKDLNEKELTRFQIEFNTMKQANSPYILEVHNYNKNNNTKLTIFQRKNIINQILKAFDYINQNIGFHRDISTTNILLKQYSDDLVVVKISDFGLVKLKDSTLTSDNTDFKGSLNDPNLDIVGGFKNYSIEHETYALTKLIYFIITGKTTIGKFKNKNFEIFIQNGISNNLNLRYKSIQEMKQAFSITDWINR